MAATTGYRYIEFNGRGAPVIAGTGFKVAVLVEQMHSWAWSPEDVHANHPQLSLAQIHAALAYYHDHVEKIEQEIAQGDREYEVARQRAAPQPSRTELEARLSSKPKELDNRVWFVPS
ncbi:MAG: DUF433 domain-containing protein [Chloroflexota bacterium]